MAVCPGPLVANAAGEIVDLPGLRAAARAGDEVFPLDTADLVPLPQSGELSFLPARTPLGFDGATQRPVRDALAVAAFLPPGWTGLALAAYRPASDAPLLPLYAYTAAFWYRGRIFVPSRRAQDDPQAHPQPVFADTWRRG